MVTLSFVHSVQAVYPKEAISLNGQIEVALIPVDIRSREKKKKTLKWGGLEMEEERFLAVEIFITWIS